MPVIKKIKFDSYYKKEVYFMDDGFIIVSDEENAIPLSKRQIREIIETYKEIYMDGQYS